MRTQLIFLAFLLVIALTFAVNVQHKVKNLAQADTEDVNGKQYPYILSL